MARKGFKDAQSRFWASKGQIQRYHLQRLRRTILSDDILHNGALIRDRIDFPMQKITQAVQNDGVVEYLDWLQDFGIMPYDDIRPCITDCFGYPPLFGCYFGGELILPIQMDDHQIRSAVCLFDFL